MYRVIVTGSRDFTDFNAVDSAMYHIYSEVAGDGKFHKKTHMVFIHGGARGADSLAERVVANNRPHIESEVYLADWDAYGKAAGPIRNRQMLDQGADLVLAFYKTGAKNIGTQHMVDIAESAGIPVRKFYED